MALEQKLAAEKQAAVDEKEEMAIHLQDALLQLEQSRIQLEEMATLKAELLKLQAVSERNRILVDTLRTQVMDGEKNIAELLAEKEENELKVNQFESEREDLQIQISVLTGNLSLSFLFHYLISLSYFLFSSFPNLPFILNNRT